MHAFVFSWALKLFTMLFFAGQIQGLDSLEIENQSANPMPTEPSYEAFTGKIIRNKVRLRLQPSLDALILTELNRDTLLSVVGEVDEFYAVLPLKDIKAYVFRTFVLDGVVEGKRVNVRLEPALEAPVIAQLNDGEHIEGSVSALNSKWLEITPPSSTRFYVCKEYVEKIGGPTMIVEVEKRLAEVDRQLKLAYLQAKKELHKDYPNINWTRVEANFNQMMQEFADFPNYVDQAQELLAEMQKKYLQKKISYLEAQVSALNQSALPIAQPAEQEDLNLHRAHMSNESFALEEQEKQEELAWNALFDPNTMSHKMSAWIHPEKSLYEQWAKGSEKASVYQFYQQQAMEQVRLQGMIEPYARAVKNKPGDYLLVNTSNHLPIAYLYSTKVNLQEKVGQKVSIYGVKRANHSFAFPAYYVLSIE